MSLTEMLSISSTGLWTGVIFVTIAKCLTHVIEIILKVFKQA